MNDESPLTGPEAGDTEPVRVGFDAGPLGYPPSGIRTYVEALIEHLSPTSNGIELSLLQPDGLFADNLPRKASRFWWDVHGAGAQARRAGVDILHVPHGAAPMRTGIPCVVTVHDLIPLTEPAYRTGRAMRLYQRIMLHTIPTAAAIIVPSDYVAAAVRECYRLPRSTVHVIPMAVGPQYRPAADEERPEDALTQLGIHGPYCFNVGGFDARKNLPALLQAFAEFLKKAPEPFQLVIGGAPHTQNQAVFPPLEPVIERLGLRNHVVLPGLLDEPAKIALYQHAAMYVTPSLSEGFGLTMLEAMSCGAPVIASDRTSLPEVAGDAALLVEPAVEKIAIAMQQVADDSALREDLRRNGIERAAGFTWERTARMTAEVYRKVVGAS